MVKVMGNGDVLRCLAKSIIYRPVRPGKYRIDACCDRKCVPLGKEDLCLALRNTIDSNGR